MVSYGKMSLSRATPLPGGLLLHWLLGAGLSPTSRYIFRLHPSIDYRGYVHSIHLYKVRLSRFLNISVMTLTLVLYYYIIHIKITNNMGHV